MNATKNRLFAKYGHDCETTSSWEDLKMFQGSTNIITQIRRSLIRSRMASELNVRGTMFLRSQKALEEEHRGQIRHLHIIHPFSVFRKYWELFMIVVFATVFIIIPLDLASFECPIQGHLNTNTFWKWLRLLFDLFCLSDVMINFFTGYCDYIKRRVVMDPKKIATRYVVTYFFPDLLSSIPTHLDLLLPFGPQRRGTAKDPLSTIFQYTSCFKITRLFTFYRYCRRQAEAFKLNHGTYRVILSLFSFTTFFHIITCLNVVQTGIFLEAVTIARRENAEYANHVDQNNSQITFFAIYMEIFFKSTHTALGSKIGRTLWHLNLIFPRIFGVIHWGIAKLIFFYVVSQWIYVATTVRSSKNKYREMVRQLREYMRYKQLPEHLQKRLISYYEFRFQKSYFRESEILSTISGQLRQEIVMHSCRKLVENVEFFKNLPVSLIIRIVSALISDIYMVNDVIIRVNTVGDCMYFIASGCVAVYAKGGHEVRYRPVAALVDIIGGLSVLELTKYIIPPGFKYHRKRVLYLVCHLEDGNFFGEVALVDCERLRCGSVVAVETCELYKLQKEDFVKAILPYPDLMDKIKRIAYSRLEQTEYVGERIHKQRQTKRTKD